MKFSALFTAAATIASLGAAAAQEALRFGTVDVSPSVIKPEQNFTVHYNSTRAVHHPKYYDSYIQGFLPNGFVLPQYLLSRNDYGPDETNHYFTTSLPADFPYIENATWLVWAQVTYPIDNTPDAALEYGGTSAAVSLDLEGFSS
ncbi:hypothetical protein PHLGIDRAFT_35625 [Phlebiopsis gigantea 11061_1 CR5-6]|uniref:Uncharacterized protein n=1 Tax=Phlebiopsis gigantea (strain 11061_1 CR5-6) TaxID=745531 RepID=A0A0C3RYC3_PHLG1|nr:hypothetical protein PHLGIDRAFT_35625 [Phlebiopsis gigantea 11061_1 CR5-6]